MKEQKFGPIRFIPGANSGRYPNCHSIFIEKADILVDPGSDRELLESLRKEKNVNQVWLTHWHEDHIMNLDLFEDVPLYTSKQAAIPLRGIDAFMEAYGTEKELKEFWQPVLEQQFRFKPRQPEGYLEACSGMNLGSVTVDIIETPGHACGHLSFFFHEPDVLFLGDYDLTSFGPWYGDVDSSIEETFLSIENLKNIGAGTCLTSHEKGIFRHPENHLWDSYAEVIWKREEKLIELLSTPQTMESLANSWIIYGKRKEPVEFYLFGERVHVAKHLERLASEDRLISDGTTFQIKQ